MRNKQIALNTTDVIETALNKLAATYQIEIGLLKLVVKHMKDIDLMESREVISRLAFILKNFPPSLIQENYNQHSLVDWVLIPQNKFLKVLSQNPFCPLTHEQLLIIYSHIRQDRDLTSPAYFNTERTLQKMETWITKTRLPAEYFTITSLEKIANDIILNLVEEINNRFTR